jgi:hypothetical protein
LKRLKYKFSSTVVSIFSTDTGFSPLRISTFTTGEGLGLTMGAITLALTLKAHTANKEKTDNVAAIRQKPFI